MTLINGVSPSEEILVDRNMLSRLESLLQSNNDVVLAIHKVFVDQTAEFNRNIESLRDDMREMKRIFLQTQQEGVSEEASKWRVFTEALLSKQLEQHGHDMTRLIELFKAMSTTTLAPSATTTVSSIGVMPALVQSTQSTTLAKPAQSTTKAEIKPSVAPSAVSVIATVQPPLNTATIQPLSVTSNTAVAPVAKPFAFPGFASAQPPTASIATTAQSISTSSTAAIAPSIGVSQFDPKPTAFSGFGNAQPPVTASIVTAAQAISTSSVTAVVPATKPSVEASQFGSKSTSISSSFGSTQPPAAAIVTTGTTIQTTNSITAVVPVAKPSIGASQFDQKPTAFSGFGSAQSPAASVVTTAQPISTSSVTTVAQITKHAFGTSSFGNKSATFPGFGSVQQPAATTFPGFGNALTGTTTPATTAPAAEKQSLFGGGIKSASPFSNQGGGSPFSGNQGGLKFGDFIGQKGSENSFLAPKQAGTGSFGSPKDYKLFQQPQNQKQREAKEGGSDAESGDEFVPDAHFEPVIPLPSLVEVKTGEEDEDVVLGTRCKLYRYDSESKENKERGIGEIKILHNRKTDRYRCVMRRDQVLKICANFPIHSNFVISQRQNIPNVYQWHCKDYSDDPVNGLDSVLIAKFKEAAVAKEFADKITEMANNQKS